MPDENNPDTESYEFGLPDNGEWHYTIMRDWIPLCTDLSDSAVRVYWVIRSIMNEKGDRTRRMSADELCWLVPGPKGKPSSETRIKTALRELEAIGLLSNPDGDVVRRWVYDTRTGKRTKENFRRWTVWDYPDRSKNPPPDSGSTYSGWPSAITKHRAYPGKGWRGVVDNSTPAAAAETSGTEGRNSDPQPQPADSEPVTSEKAASSQVTTERRNSASLRRNSASPRRNSVADEAVTSEDPHHKEAPQGRKTRKYSSSSSRSSSTQHAGSDDTARSTETEEEETTNTTHTDIARPTGQGSGDADASAEEDLDTRLAVNDALKRFWGQLPTDVAPNATQRRKIGKDTDVRALFIEDEWGAGDGPELLASWLRRRIPIGGVVSRGAWVRSQLVDYAPSGPTDVDRMEIVPHEQCPNECDENYWVLDALNETVRYRCPEPHTTSAMWRELRAPQFLHTGGGAGSPGDHPEEDPADVQARFLASLESAPGIAPAGAGVSDVDGVWQPPF